VARSVFRPQVELKGSIELAAIQHDNGWLDRDKEQGVVETNTKESFYYLSYCFSFFCSAKKNNKLHSFL